MLLLFMAFLYAITCKQPQSLRTTTRSLVAGSHLVLCVGTDAPQQASSALGRDLQMYLPSLFLLSCIQKGACVQRVDGEEAGNICKQEFQDFIKFYVAPLVELKVQERLDRENAEAITPRYTVNKIGPDGTTAIPEQWTLQEICDFWRAELVGAYIGLRAKLWSAHQGVHISAYEPTCRGDRPPYFVSLDNAGAHSFWLCAITKKHMNMRDYGPSLLQFVTIPPQGHDAHQIVEHGIGVIKSHVNKQLRLCLKAGRQPTQAILDRAVKDGMLLFGATAHARNIRRLRNCMRVVAARKGSKVAYTREVCTDKKGDVWVEQELFAWGTQGAFPPKTIA